MQSLTRAPRVLAVTMVGLGTLLASAPARAFRLAVPAEEPATTPATPPGGEAGSEASTETGPASPSTTSPSTTSPSTTSPSTTSAPATEDVVPPPPESEGEPDDAAGIEIIHAPDGPLSREEAEELEQRRLDEEIDALPPPPDPEWRLRIGAGLGLPLAGASAPFLRLHQEIEWQPTGAAPFLFGLGGAEYVGPGVLGSAAVRLGAATDFCRDSVVRCQAAIVLVLGAFFGQNLVAFDAGGEGDVRFLFGPVELSVRVGFGGGGGYNFLTGSGGVGVAF